MRDFIGYTDLIGAGDLAYPQRKFSDLLANMSAAQGVNPNALAVAALQAVPAAVQAFAQQRKQPLGMPENMVSRDDYPNTMRRIWLGLGDELTVLPGATSVQIVTPQLTCRISRLIITCLDGTANDFTVTDIRVGNQPQINGQAALPGAMFAADGFNLDSATNTVNLGNTVTIAIRNRNAANRTFALGAVAYTLAP